MKDNELRVQGFTEFLYKEYPPVEMVLSPWLPRRGIAMIAGYRGIGKTLLAMGVAYTVATGGSILGWHAPKPRKVLYLDGEMDPAEFQQRLRAFDTAARRRGVGQPALAPRNFSVLTHSDCPLGIPDLADPHGLGRRRVEDALGDHEVMIWDNLSSTCNTGVENDAESWTVVQEWLLHLRRKEKTVIFLHHTGKPDKETGLSTQRGTSKREDVLNTSILLQSSPNKPRDKFQLHFSKTRGFAAPEPFDVHMEFAEDEIWLGLKDGRKQEMENLLTQGLSVTQIAELLGVNKSTISRWIRTTSVAPPRRGRPTDEQIAERAKLLEVMDEL